MRFNIHGGHNNIVTGASGYLNEVTEDRKVTAEVIRLLRLEGHIVYDCTDNSGTTKNGNLKNIVKKCNANSVDLDVSIHLNAGGGHGVETWNYSEKTKAYSDRINANIAEALGIRNRGTKYTQDFYVLRNTTARALLIECCFVDSKEDFEKWNATKCGKAIAEAILNKTIEEKKPTATATPAKPTAKPLPANIKVGDTVTYNGYVYANSYGENRGSKVNGSFVVNKVNGNEFGVHLKGLGWVSPKACGTASYYPKCSAKQLSLVDGLKEVGVKDTSKTNRAKIAKANGYKSYPGTAGQNNALLKLLKAGKLKKA